LVAPAPTTTAFALILARLDIARDVGAVLFAFAFQ
jgi:hypothetical protein